MTWNISFSLFTLGVLIILLIFYFSRPQLNLRRNRAFVALLLSQMATLLLDVVASEMDNTYTRWPVAALYLANMFYFVAFQTRSMLVLLFSKTILTKRNEERWMEYVGLSIYAVYFALVLLSPATGSIFRITPQGYQAGSLYFTLYWGFYLYIAGGFYLLYKYRDRLPKNHQLGACTALLMLVVGAIIRSLFPMILVMNMFFLFAILIVYLAFENPENRIESRTRCFNQQALQDVINENTGTDRYLDILAFRIQNYMDKRVIYGSEIMDRSLSEIGIFIRQRFPHADWFYLRNGHFFILSEEPGQMQFVAKALMDRFDDVWEVAGLTHDIGIVTLNASKRGIRFDHLIEGIYLTMDKHFPESSDNGSNPVHEIDEEDILRLEREVKVQKILDRAIAHHEVQAWLQPIVDAQTGRIVAAEALARIDDPIVGLIPPGEFIPLAERSGQIVALGEQMLAAACRMFSENDFAQKGIRWINVNLSPIQCQDINMPKRICSIVDRYQIPHSRIQLEVTEEAMVDPVLIGRQMKALIEEGFNVALDDYGSGFSNIIRLKSLPFHSIKVDMSVVQAHFRNPDNILPDTVQMLSAKGFQLTAEGVETQEMAMELKAMGFTQLQGYCYSKPIPVPAFEQMLLAGRAQ